MNGTEHYQEAQRQLRLADEDMLEDATYRVAVAQVHATLALTAATEVGAWTRNTFQRPITDPWLEDRVKSGPTSPALRAAINRMAGAE